MRPHWISYQTTPMNVQDPSTRMHLDQNEGGVIAQAKRLQSDLEAMGNKIKQHDDNLKYLQAQKNKLDEAIIDLHVDMINIRPHRSKNSETSCFAKPAASRTMDYYSEAEKKMEELECEKDKTMEDIKREQVLRDHALFNFVKKKDEFALFLAQSSITDQVAKLALKESI